MRPINHARLFSVREVVPFRPRAKYRVRLVIREENFCGVGVRSCTSGCDVIVGDVIVGERTVRASEAIHCYFEVVELMAPSMRSAHHNCIHSLRLMLHIYDGDAGGCREIWNNQE
jgi:hypothetical protein